jgi:hypothetical protein
MQAIDAIPGTRFRICATFPGYEKWVGRTGKIILPSGRHLDPGVVEIVFDEAPPGFELAWSPTSEYQVHVTWIEKVNGSSVPKSKICACGISRQDCDYHK